MGLLFLRLVVGGAVGCKLRFLCQLILFHSFVFSCSMAFYGFGPKKNPFRGKNEKANILCFRSVSTESSHGSGGLEMVYSHTSLAALTVLSGCLHRLLPQVRGNCGIGAIGELATKESVKTTAKINRPHKSAW